MKLIELTAEELLQAASAAEQLKADYTDTAQAILCGPLCELAALYCLSCHNEQNAPLFDSPRAVLAHCSLGDLLDFFTRYEACYLSQASADAATESGINEQFEQTLAKEGIAWK